MASRPRSGVKLLLLSAVLLHSVCADAPRPRPPALRRPADRSSQQQLVATTAVKAPTTGVLLTAFQIINNVAGAGILTLSAGMAAGVGWVPAVAICVVLGAISGYTFYLLGEACGLTGTETFKDLWAATLGASTSWVVDLCIGLMCLSAAIIYSGILGDVFTPLLQLARLPAAWNRRGSNIVALTALVLAPLSLLEDLSALSFTSILGCASVVYTAAFMAVRAVDGSYKGGALVASLPAHLAPSFAKASLLNLDINAFVLVSNLGLAFIAHYNAPAFYQSLTDASPRRFGLAVSLAFSCLTVLYVACMGFGYATFGDAAASNVLRNYAEGDSLAIAGRLATGASILFGYPLAMVGLVSAARGLCVSLADAAPPRLAAPLRAAAAPANRRAVVLGALGLVTVVALLLTDIGLVVGVSGAVLGAAIVYIIPAFIALNTGATPAAAPALFTLVPLGVLIGVLGVAMSVQ